MVYYPVHHTQLSTMSCHTDDTHKPPGHCSTCRHYRKSSFNVRPYHECMEFWDVSRTRRKHYSSWNNQRDCESHGGTWQKLHSFLEKAPGGAACLSSRPPQGARILTLYLAPLGHTIEGDDSNNKIIIIIMYI